MILISGLFPSTSRLLLAIKNSSPMRQLDRQMGRDPDRPKKTLSVEQFTRDVGGG